MPYSASATSGPLPSPGPRTLPRWWTELLLIVVVYGAYSGGRLLARGDVSTAVDHGLAILRIEKMFLLNAEHPLNRLFTSTPAIGIPADFIYASLHYLVTPAVLIWIFRRRPAAYRAARTWLMLSTLLGLVGFTLLPTCPPRLLDAGHGFVDTMAQYSSYGWWGAEASAPRGLGGMTNQYAAMPSLHVGWALWCGLLLWRHARTPLVRWLGLAYPLLITVVVMGTANHYFLDAVAGCAVMGLGALLTAPGMRAAARARAWAGTRTGATSGARVTTENTAAQGVPSASPARSSTASAPRSAPIVSAGCETSAGERFPEQRTRANSADDGVSGVVSGGSGDGSSASAADDTPAATR
ncbi:phosphatase PAP2 family protein [Streptomyces paludis]|uniref:PAP2 family protein n=1 Tax=Streptomyces paludis TaxID=2282738 RepID=A0A345HMT8_9ACTN|nr:phosphatase PAP2 family protein [Streptomyces paludis]AXG78012.1 PAP2 family protein [Streptomyces paludis]